MTDKQTNLPDAEKADAEAVKASEQASKARVAAQEAAEKANDQRSPEQKKADDLADKADDLEAVAAEKGADATSAKDVSTVAEAKVLAIVHPDTDPGEHRAQKFGNDPSNPAPAPGVDMTANLVKLRRKTPDVPEGYVTCEVPKEMVGDYCRAGWSVAP